MVNLKNKMTVLSIINEKGGVGKSTLALNMAVELSKRGWRILLMDNDPQSNITTRLVDSEERQVKQLNEFREKLKSVHADSRSEKEHLDESLELLTEFLNCVQNEEIVRDMNDVYLNPIAIKKAIVHTEYKNLDIVPATHKLSTTDLQLKMETRNVTTRIRQALDYVDEDYDVVIIDNSPVDSSLTYNAFCACKNDGDMIIIPTKLDKEAWAGMLHTVRTLMQWLEDPYQDLNYDFRVVASMTSDTKYSKEAIATLNELWNSQWNKRFMNSQIHFQNAPIQGNSYENNVLVDQSQKRIRDSRVYKDYIALIDEVEETLLKKE